MTGKTTRHTQAKESHLRAMRKAVPAYAAVMFAVMPAVMLIATGALAGQPIDINSLPSGARFCPAPWADNSEFMSSYFSIDARTGQMTRHDPGSGPVGVTPEPIAREEVLFVSPPISVENVYVPPPGGPAVPPRTGATGTVQPSRRPQPPQAYQPAPQPYRQPQRPVPVQPQRPVAPQPPQYPQYPQPYPPQAYAQPLPQRRAYPQPYPSPQPQQSLQPYPQRSYMR